MTRQEMVAKLDSLHVGMMIERDGKYYEVLYARCKEPEKPLHRTAVRLLEIGKPRYEQVAGKYLAEGKTFEVDNSRVHDWYAQRQYMNWQVVEA